MLLRLALLVLPLALLSACASTHGPTHGWSAVLRRSQPTTRQFTYFELRRDGQLTYLAGPAAASTDPSALRPTWRGPLDDAEIASVSNLLNALASVKEIEADDGGVTYRLKFQRAGSFPKMLVTGPTPELDLLYAAFDQAQRRRRTEELSMPVR